MSRYIHYAHLSEIGVPGAKVPLGRYVERGDIVGKVGSSGNSSGPHLHAEIMMSKPISWRQYTRGKSHFSVQRGYQDPKKFYDNSQSIPISIEYPIVGYGFMQFVKDGTRPYGGYWHPGDDANGIRDFGKDVRSLLPGRIVHIEDVSWLKNKFGKWLKTDWNGGWGRHLFIEVDEAKCAELGLI